MVDETLELTGVDGWRGGRDRADRPFGLARAFRWFAAAAAAGFWLWAGLQISASYDAGRQAADQRVELAPPSAHPTGFGAGLAATRRASRLQPPSGIAKDEASARAGQWAAIVAFLNDCILFGGLALGLIAVRWVLWELFPNLDL